MVKAFTAVWLSLFPCSFKTVAHFHSLKYLVCFCYFKIRFVKSQNSVTFVSTNRLWNLFSSIWVGEPCKGIFSSWGRHIKKKKKKKNAGNIISETELALLQFYVPWEIIVSWAAANDYWELIVAMFNMRERTEKISSTSGNKLRVRKSEGVRSLCRRRLFITTSTASCCGITGIRPILFYSSWRGTRFPESVGMSSVWRLLYPIHPANIDL